MSRRERGRVTSAALQELQSGCAVWHAGWMGMRAWAVPQAGVRPVNIVGMEYREADVDAVLRLPLDRRSGAVVMHEANNAYDPWACAVIVEGHHIGYLRSHVAKRYGPTMSELQRHGMYAWVGCRIDGDYTAAVGLPSPDVFARAVSAVIPTPPRIQLRGQPFNLWSCPDWAGTDIDGETAHMMHLYRLMENQSPGFEAAAALAPNAGRWYVIIDGGEVGYLQKPTQSEYGQALGRILALGLLPMVRATITWDEDHDAGPWPWVRISLGDPDLLMPADRPPAVRHLLLPQGGKLKIAHPDVESCEEAVAAYTGSPVGRVLVHGILTDDGAAKPRVSVEVGGVHLGTFTPAVSKHLVPLVRTVQGTGLAAVAAVEVTAMPGAAEVVVLARRASDTPLEWFQQMARG